MIKFNWVVILCCVAFSGCSEDKQQEDKFSEFKITENQYYNSKGVPVEHRDGSSFQGYLNKLKVVESLLSENPTDKLLSRDLISSAEFLTQKVINRYVDLKVLEMLKTIDLKQYYHENSDKFSTTSYIVDEYYLVDFDNSEVDVERVFKNLKGNRKELKSNNLSQNIKLELEALSENELTASPLLVGDFYMIYRLIEKSHITPDYKDVEFRVRSDLTSTLKIKIEAELLSEVI